MATPTTPSWPTSAVIATTLAITSIIVLAFGADPVLAADTAVASLTQPAPQALTGDETAASLAAVPAAVSAAVPAAVSAEEQVGNPGPLEELFAAAVRDQLEAIIGRATSDGVATAGPVPPPPPAREPVVPPIDAAGRTPSGWLTPVNNYWLSARFGQSGPWSSGHHTGLDFVAPAGTPVRAPVAGVVVAAAPAGAYGNLIQLRIAPGTELWFAHLRRFDVAVGDYVHQGQVLGPVGMTGHTTGPHSHFEVRVRGRVRNPERYFWPAGNTAERH